MVTDQVRLKLAESGRDQSPAELPGGHLTGGRVVIARPIVVGCIGGAATALGANYRTGSKQRDFLPGFVLKL
jgi:hypothetical protein